MTLEISKDLSLPLEAVTETFAILAKRGKGKTNTAVVMAEEMIAAGLPVVIVDPVGVWWGIRSSADGKGDGLPVVIFGGDHADVPLEETAGELVADVIVDRVRRR
jgi:DNA helicase HerA-like ATPase